MANYPFQFPFDLPAQTFVQLPFNVFGQSFGVAYVTIPLTGINYILFQSVFGIGFFLMQMHGPVFYVRLNTYMVPDFFRFIKIGSFFCFHQILSICLEILHANFFYGINFLVAKSGALMLMFF